MTKFLLVLIGSAVVQNTFAGIPCEKFENDLAKSHPQFRVVQRCAQENTGLKPTSGQMLSGEFCLAMADDGKTIITSDARKYDSDGERLWTDTFAINPVSGQGHLKNLRVGNDGELSFEGQHVSRQCVASSVWSTWGQLQSGIRSCARWKTTKSWAKYAFAPKKVGSFSFKEGKNLLAQYVCE